MNLQTLWLANLLQPPFVLTHKDQRDKNTVCRTVIIKEDGISFFTTDKIWVDGLSTDYIAISELPSRRLKNVGDDGQQIQR